jgi:hypothetical protein
MQSVSSRVAKVVKGVWRATIRPVGGGNLHECNNVI